MHPWISCPPPPRAHAPLCKARFKQHCTSTCAAPSVASSSTGPTPTWLPTVDATAASVTSADSTDSASSTPVTSSASQTPTGAAAASAPTVCSWSLAAAAATAKPATDAPAEASNSGRGWLLLGVGGRWDTLYGRSSKPGAANPGAARARLQRAHVRGSRDLATTVFAATALAARRVLIGTLALGCGNGQLATAPTTTVTRAFSFGSGHGV